MEVSDARVRSALCRQSRWLPDAPDIRFYAGAPIEMSDGLRMGSLCVIDREPGVLEPHQRDALMALARAAAEALELRRYALEQHAAHASASPIALRIR